MKSFLLTLLPMSLVAVFVIFGGERLARQKNEERTPINQKRFSDFSLQFREETERLQKLYIEHLNELAYLAYQEKGFGIKDSMKNISGVHSLLILDRLQRGNDISLESSTEAPKLIIEGQFIKPPANAITIPKSVLKAPQNSDGNYNGYWSSTIRNGFRLYLTRPVDNVSVAMLIDLKSTQLAEQKHLSQWAKKHLISIQGNSELLAIKRKEHIIVSTGGIPESLPSSFIPIRNNIGQWDIQAWDRISITQEYNPAILSATVLLSLALLTSGFFLYSHQQRALKLAENRVSFVNRVSHELGTPLTNICLNLDLAEEDIECSPQEAQRRLGLVKEEVGRLGRLVSNVLTFAKFKEQRLKTDPHLCDPKEIIDQALRTYKPALLRRGFDIEINIHDIPHCHIDADALSQITGNLISNVEKYAVSGKWISLNCTHQNDILVLEITDKGPGIPKNKRDDIFRPFIRSRHDTNEGSSGSGLGLTISKDLAENMGGNLIIVSLKKGSQFKLTIPCPSNSKPLKKENS